MGVEKGSEFKGLEKQFRKVVHKIQKDLDYWLEKLYIEHWDIQVCYVPAYCHSDRAIRARAKCQWEYRNGTIEFFLVPLADCTRRELEGVVLHELVHFIVDPVVTKKTDSKCCECVVVDITNALMNTKYCKEKPDNAYKLVDQPK